MEETAQVYAHPKPFVLPKEDAPVKVMFVPIGKRGGLPKLSHARYAHPSSRAFGKMKRGERVMGVSRAIPMFILMKQVSLKKTNWINDAMQESANDIGQLLEVISRQVKRT